MSHTNLDHFRQLVLRDPALQQLLRDAPDRDACLTLLLALGQAHGYSFTADELRSASQASRRVWRESSRAEHGRPSDALTPSNLAGWIPIRLYWQAAQPMVDWCYLGERRLTEPFFEQTIDSCFRDPFALLFRHQTSVAVLEEMWTTQPGIPPTGFIFHMSRCGSTLVSQLLASLPQAVVISEAPPIDDVLRAMEHDSSVTDRQRIDWLRGMVNALGQRRHGQERYCFIKFDCWHTLDLPLIGRAFPDVPWIFVYRHPLEVLVSHKRIPGSQMVPGLLPPALFGFDAAMVAQIPPDEYAARVLAQICGAVLQYGRHNTGRLVSYRQLPEAVWQMLPGVFGIESSAEDRERMQILAQFQAKEPALHFVDDTAAKWRAASDRMHVLAEQWVVPLYERLETMKDESL